MKAAFVGLAGVATLVAAVFASAPSLTASASPAGKAKPRTILVYGHIKTLKRNGDRFEMRFDPAWFLSGVAAERAKLEDTGSREVPNDNYIVEEGHRLLTYVVSPTARVTVLTRRGAGPIPTTVIRVSELRQIVQGKNPRHRQLLERKAGFWIRIGDKYPNPVVALDQQYQP